MKAISTFLCATAAVIAAVLAPSTASAEFIPCDVDQVSGRWQFDAGTNQDGSPLIWVIEVRRNGGVAELVFVSGEVRSYAPGQVLISNLQPYTNPGVGYVQACRGTMQTPRGRGEFGSIGLERHPSSGALSITLYGGGGGLEYLTGYGSWSRVQ